MKNGILLLTALILAFSLHACGEESEQLPVDVRFSDRGRDVPEFSADSAYAFLEKQLSFGPRNPNSEGHILAGDYFTDILGEFSGGLVFNQRFQHEGYDETLHMRNIIAAFNPEATDRILLCAHWDTRPRAERDSNENRRDEPIMGADDGASGVAVLLEIARVMRENPPPVGVDIILFDGEDYGKESDLQNYFLGSRYWVNNPPVPGYRPSFGILLDMVGGEGALFPREGYSRQYARRVLDAVWSIAREKGYERFLDEDGMFVQDDHMILNEQYDLPTINIINQRRDGDSWGFPEWWHTHRDDIEIIDPAVMQDVGDVLLELIYNRI